MRQGQIPQHAEFLRACGESNPRCPMPERLIAPRLCHWTMPRMTKLMILIGREPYGGNLPPKMSSPTSIRWGLLGFEQSYKFTPLFFVLGDPNSKSLTFTFESHFFELNPIDFCLIWDPNHWWNPN
ncbi:hypothetical protein K7X08_002714 [Anisodus acutangulus]|uniref:Uncharacterized protein n=1 Tax=Anisodus acutangulus TaxID=402998 RepID=A0A9Q1ME23_9SOLA|nr:hypothetical protein K7X08_002714 [Anisodus acutangulus]